MKTVAELIQELNKFPDDAECNAYEGEACGIVITHVTDDGTNRSGFIYCSDTNQDEPPTDLL